MTLAATSHSPGPGEIKEDFWVEERFWGHRLWDQQSPWLLFLEFLSVAEHAHRNGDLFQSDKAQYPFSYHPYLRLHLRNILFNGEQKLAEIAERIPDSGAAWREWLSWMREHSRGLDPDERDFSYLVTRFSSFQHFAQLIRALRSCAVESDANKRWSSRFIFPFGQSATFVDLGVNKEGRVESSEYINFGRTGELLYQMLARSTQAKELSRVFPQRLFRANKWNDLVQRLQPESASTMVVKRGTGVSSFLPYDQHPIFELIAEDWLRLLSRDLPGFDVVPYLVTTGAFGIFLYQLRTSTALLGRNTLPPIICEVVARRKALVRERSVESYEANNDLSREALDAILNRIERTDDWNMAGSVADVVARRRDLLKREFHWEDDTQTADPDELWRLFKDKVRARHRQHFGQVHRSYGRGIGLVSRRGTNRLRYAPTDAFLKALLFANVDRRMEFGRFLQLIFDRYGLVFGEAQAEAVLNSEDFDKKQFESNCFRLEQRLSSLGLLRRLSDACAYVENPYTR
jgi:hypothetical protein